MLREQDENFQRANRQRLTGWTTELWQAIIASVKTQAARAPQITEPRSSAVLVIPARSTAAQTPISLVRTTSAQVAEAVASTLVLLMRAARRRVVSNTHVDRRLLVADKISQLLAHSAGSRWIRLN